MMDEQHVLLHGSTLFAGARAGLDAGRHEHSQSRPSKLS